MAAQDHNNYFRLLSSVILEAEEYLDALEAGLATIEKRRRLEEEDSGERQFYPKTHSIADTLGARNARFVRYLDLVCGPHNGP